MKLSKGRGLSFAVMGLCLFSLTAATAGAADKKVVVQQARNSYYSLKNQGLVEFQCSMTPDWKALLQDTRKTDPGAADRATQILSQLQFTVSLGTAGSAKVTHTTVTPTNNDMAAGLNQIYGGMEQMVSGFFDTWSPFMISSPFPEADDTYELADQGQQWALSYKQGTADVATTMDKNFAIRELKVTTPEFSSVIQPQFTSSAQGFLLAGYVADYVGKSPSETTHLQVGIAYQSVNGFQLPQKLNLGGSYGGSAFQVEVAFSGCQAKKQ
jgi:hypothetical protein